MNLLEICTKHKISPVPPLVDAPPLIKTVLDFNGAGPQRMDRDDRLKSRLLELIRMAENSRGLSEEQVKAISNEGDLIIDQLPPETVREIFQIK